MSERKIEVPRLDPLQEKEHGVMTPLDRASWEKTKPHRYGGHLFREALSETLLEKCEVMFEFAAAASVLDQYVQGHTQGIARSPLGVPAAAGLLEELIAFGVNRFIACRSSGLVGAMDPKDFLLLKRAFTIRARSPL